MPISVVCRFCGIKLRAPDKAAGHKTNCPKCESVITVPGDLPKVKPWPRTHAQPQLANGEATPAPQPTPVPTLPGNLEIHLIKVEDTHTSSSVEGSVSGTMHGGSGRISGRTDTKHTSTIIANGRSYELKQTNQQYPFRAGDDVLIACSWNGTKGVYHIRALISLTNGTRYMPNLIVPQIMFWGMFLLSFIAMIAILGLPGILFQVLRAQVLPPVLLALVALGSLVLGIWYSFVEFPKLNEAHRALEAIAASPQNLIDLQRAHANGFSGPSTHAPIQHHPGT